MSAVSDARKRLADSRDESRGNADRWTELRALTDAATEGPWVALGNTIGAEVKGRLPAETGTATADAEFIAAARQAVPDLLAEVDRLTAALAAADAHARTATFATIRAEQAERERDGGFEAIALRFNALGAKLEQAERQARELREGIEALAEVATAPLLVEALRALLTGETNG